MSLAQAPTRATDAARPPAREDPIAQLIRRAVATDVPRLVKAADKIQDLVDQLEAEVEAHERGAELRAEAERIEARLAEIKAQLGGKRAAHSVLTEKVDTKAVRKWAAANGIECPNRGRIPRAVMAAYEEAHP